jgi:hypothetical protein
LGSSRAGIVAIATWNRKRELNIPRERGAVRVELDKLGD